MNKLPRIGSRVRFKGNAVNGPCTGTVLRHYPSEEWDEHEDRPTGRMRPEREWSVAVKVDQVPERWAYTDTDVFAPPVSELSPAT